MATLTTNGSQSDVQAKINAAVDTDIVAIPTGSFTWASGVSWTNKNITLQGNGITNTIITCNAGSTVSINADTKAFRVTGFRIDVTGSGGTGGVFAISQTNARSSSQTPVKVEGWRIDNIRINHSGSSEAYPGLINGWFANCLIDHCYLYNSGGYFPGFRFWEMHGASDTALSPLGGQYGDGSHARTRATGMGTSDAVFLEDNTVEKTAGGSYVTLIDGSAGSRCVVRYNTFIGGYPCGLQRHNAGNTGLRGATFTEIYNNTWQTNGDGDDIILISSGTGLCYNNTANATAHLVLQEQRVSTATEYPYCDGTWAWDGNAGDASCPGWPAIDQVGRGSSTTAGPHGNYNIAEPFYVWGNTGVSIETLPSAYIKATTHTNGEVDYVSGSAKPGWTPYTYPHPLQGLSAPTGTITLSVR